MPVTTTNSASHPVRGLRSDQAERSPDSGVRIAGLVHAATAWAVDASIIRAAFSPIMIDGALVLAEVSVGMIEASATGRAAATQSAVAYVLA
jgi:hypothetical protein